MTDDRLDLRIKAKCEPHIETDDVPVYKYDITLHNSLNPIGCIDLRVGSHESLYYWGHIGYEIKANFRGHHHAATACKILKRLALEHNLKTLIISCDPQNIASQKTCEKIGATFIELAKVPRNHKLYLSGYPEVCVYEWSLDS